MDQEAFKAAAKGDLTSLRALRDYWVQGCPQPAPERPGQISTLPARMVINEAELLSEMCHAASDEEPDGAVMLIVVFFERLRLARSDAEGSQHFLTEAMKAGNLGDVDRWAGSVAEAQGQAALYHSKMCAVAASLMQGREVDDAATLLACILDFAGRGNPIAEEMVDPMVASLPREQAAAIRDRAKQLEKEWAEA